MLLDAAAGVGCPVIASVTGTDYCILITEPTPSGIEDMKRALGVVEHFGIPKSIIINKYDINLDKTDEIEKFAQEKNIKIAGKIPFNKSFAYALVKMKLVIEIDDDIKEVFVKIKENIMTKI
jgi:MinD superfamily P-loop ATPase